MERAVVLMIMPGTRAAVARSRSAGPSTRSATPRGKPTMWDGYESPGCWDELLVDRRARYACDGVVRCLGLLGDELAGRQAAAELAIRSMGITFTVYSQSA